MADAIKSVLFVDYDSLYRALHEADAEAAERLPARVVAWIAAIEQGRLAPSADSTLRRRVLMRRCYANPALLGDKRKHFTGNGFLVVDCPPLEGHERSAADIQMALDTIDALEHPTAYDEFILLSADTDLSPILIRLRAHNRQTVVYATPRTPDSYKAIVDGIVDQEPFIALLTAADEPKVAEPAAALAMPATAAPSEATPAADRTEIETLARKVHAATNVPLFSPKSYLELFRVLAAEIAANGYHFQSTAENVAAKLTAGGRNATRRQIVFIVKGLALKGHVFSNTDTPDRLADVFREQVVYLIRNAGLELTPREVAIMPAWIIGRVGPGSAPAEIEPDISAPEPAPPPAPVKPVAIAKPPENRPPLRPAEDQGAKAGKKKPGRPGPLGKSETAITPPPPRPSVFGPAKTGEAPKPATPTRTGVFSRPATATLAKPNPFSSTKMGSGSGAGLTKTGAPAGAASSALSSSAARPAVTPPKPPPPKPVAEKPLQEKPPAEKSSAPADKNAVESTILAAIAQAVDVLVEDSSAAKAMEKESEESASGDAPSGPAPVSDVPPPDGDDIGDEIQRIIASYNRDRQQSE